MLIVSKQWYEYFLALEQKWQDERSAYLKQSEFEQDVYELNKWLAEKLFKKTVKRLRLSGQDFEVNR